MIDKFKHQVLMDRLRNHAISIRVSREIPQMFLAKQRNSSWMLETMQHKVHDEPIFLKWENSCGTCSTTESAKVTFEDVT